MSKPGLISILCDHTRRVAVARAGFGFFGGRWLLPWLAYAMSPLITRLGPRRVADFGLFRARLRECDLYAFANVFEDYPMSHVRAALNDVGLVVDAGANVGAFSLMAATLSRQCSGGHRIVAVEPFEANVEMLRRQPYSEALEVVHGALGPEPGVGRLIEGENSVTHSIDFSSEGGVKIFSLDELCTEPALVKMDIEGGEREILERGIPANVRHLLLEWHSGPDRPDDPREFLTDGRWVRIAGDLYGSSMWLWTAGQASEPPLRRD